MVKEYRLTFMLAAIVLALALLFTPLPARAAEDAEGGAEAPAEAGAPVVQNIGLSQIWDDLSYSKFLLRNTAFYDLDEQVMKAETMEELAAALKKTDQWSQYYPTEAYPQFMNYIVGDFVGIGVYLRMEAERVVVAGVIAGSPAEKASLKSGDRIVEVDGVDTRDASMEELQALLQGEENSIVTLKYQRNGRVTELMMNRKRIIEPSMEYWFVEGTIGYVRIDKFTTHTGQELSAGIKSLKKQGMTALIIDLRDCPGGELDGAVETSGILAGVGPMLFFADRVGYQGFAPVDEAEKLGVPMAVLINGNTASSAELVAANVQDVQSGVLIGETSFGKGVVQTVRQLPSGAGLSFTTNKYISHGYQDVDAQGGLLPDIYVTGADAQREKAIAWLKEQLANPGFVKYYAHLSGYSLGGLWQNTPATVLLKDGASYVPLKLTLSKLGWTLTERDGMTYAEANGQRLIVDAEGQSLITGNGQHQLLAHQGELYMPAALLRSYGHTVTWIDNERAVRIDK